MTLALLMQTCRYAATNFGQARRGCRRRYPARQPCDSRLQIGYSIVKERWFPLPGQPQQCNTKAYCNNIIMYLSRRIHPEIPGGDTGRTGIKAQMYSQPLSAASGQALRLAQDKGESSVRRAKGASETTPLSHRLSLAICRRRFSRRSASLRAGLRQSGTESWPWLPST
jgi:hypothetical protein